MELAESNVATTLAELNGQLNALAVQGAALNSPYSREPLAPHTQAVLAVGTALLVASGLISEPEDDDADDDDADDDDAPASPPAPPCRLPSPPPPPPRAGHAVMV